MVFHGSDPDKLAGRLDDGVALLSSSGATLVLFTGPDWGSTPVLGRNRSKVAVFNENIREIASRHNALIADLWGLRELRDPRMWDRDRLHLSPPGHYAVAMRVLDALGVRHPLQPLQAGTCRRAIRSAPGPRTLCGPARTCCQRTLECRTVSVGALQ